MLTEINVEDFVLHKAVKSLGMEVRKGGSERRNQEA